MPNRLIHEQSPYLLQHAHNPVDWYPWGAEAFERARNENKPVLVSIGYAACHWCHVMERESFENGQVAAYMNEHFINIKVDREEHPDVDHLYMDAVQALTGSGGWPLNVFVTPDRLPFYGGTYFPPREAFNRPSWSTLLQRMHDIWTGQQGEVQAQTGQMLEYLRNASRIGVASQKTAWDEETCAEMARTLLEQADTQHGGFGRAPKFPGSMALSFLLEHYRFAGAEAGLEHATRSLDAMLQGGIYDQLEGGFARYSTDDEWLAPHFEKMLYDNALLVLTMADAYQATKEDRYARGIRETVAFVERELKRPSGGYYSALDADSEGVEGKFYTWTREEWLEALGGTGDELVARYFGVTEVGNWEETNILHIAQPLSLFAAGAGVEEQALKERVKSVKERLRDRRKQRVRPLTDDKCLLSWNALMNLALSRAAIVLEEAAYAEKAVAHARWMLESFAAKDGLLHVWKNGEARIPAKLDDYAFLVRALLQLGSLCMDGSWIAEAERWCGYVQARFVHEEGSFFYFTSDKQDDIPVRKADLYDGAMPSANAVMCENLLWLGMLQERAEWTEQAGQMLSRMAGTVRRYPYSFGYWALLLQRVARGPRTIIAVGAAAEAMKDDLLGAWIPHGYIFASKKEISVPEAGKAKFFPGENLIFVCTQDACMPPVHGTQDVLRLLRL